MATKSVRRQNADVPRDYQPVPESWVAHGHTAPHKHDGDRIYLAALVAVDEVEESITVLYAERFGRGGFEQTFDAVNVNGSWVPSTVYRNGPTVFPAAVSVPPREETTDVSDAAWDAVVERYERVDEDDRRNEVSA